MGTVLFFGPDDARATKALAAVIESPDTDDAMVEAWFVETGDIRNSEEIRQEVFDFLGEYGVTNPVVAEEISGCAHQEGIDYPLGETCPDCTFWSPAARASRQEEPAPPTGKLGQHLSAEEVLAALSEPQGCPPKAALASADVRRDELVAPLLKSLHAVESPEEATIDDVKLFCHALYLVAKWREPRAYASVIAWLSLPGEGAFELAGDIVMQDGSVILASVSTGDHAETRALIENREANEFCRGEALDSLATLVHWGTLPREELHRYLRELIEGKLEREMTVVWFTLAVLVIDFGFRDLVPLLSAPYEAQCIDQRAMSWQEIEDTVEGGTAESKSNFDEEHQPITDVAARTAWWQEYHEAAPDAAPVPVRSAAKPGRNDRCPCGSGKKYKKCCGA